MKKVHIADTAAEAHLVLTALEEDGIEAEVVNENLVLAMGEIPPNVDTLPAVLISRDEDEARANEVVDRFLQRRRAGKAGGPKPAPEAPSGLTTELVLIGIAALLAILLTALFVATRLFPPPA